VGVYWKATRKRESSYKQLEMYTVKRLEVYICVVPALPIRLRWEIGWR